MAIVMHTVAGALCKNGMKYMNTHQYLRELRNAAPYIVVYSVFWACAYLYFFWANFNINPFPYIGLSDIITLSAKFLFQSAIFALLILGSQTFFFTANETRKTEQKEIASLKFRILLSILISVPSLYYSYDHPALAAIAIGATIPAITPLSYVAIFKQMFSSKPVRIAASALIVSLPLFAITTAKTESSEILQQKGNLDMIRTPLGICSPGCIFIGKLGDYFSVIPYNGKTIMIKSDKIQFFEIYKNNYKI